MIADIITLAPAVAGEMAGIPVATLEHTPASAGRVQRAVTPMVAMALNNDRVHAQAVAQLEQLVASRRRILEGIQQRRVANPVVLTGDVHQHWANDLKADFSDPDSRTIGSELVCTSITSGGDGTPEPTPAGQRALAENPHIKFNSNQRGYVRCGVTRGEWRADFRVVPYVKRPGAPISTVRSFTIEAGSPGLQPAS